MTAPRNKGYLIILMLIFGSVFFVVIAGFMGFVITQKQAQTAKADKELALQIAEAGLDYYKWYLAHYPNDTTNGTGTPGPYVHGYEDPEGGEIGEFSLEVASTTACGDLVSVDITSTGYTHDAPNVKRKVFGRYARPNVAEYSFIINTNVWAGADRVIIGPYHSNGGIRMDGTNNSTVSSGVESWLCTSSFGCSPSQTRDGVFGAGPNDELWSFPSPPINFVGLTVDLSNMQTKAQTLGRYFGPSGNEGYHLVFQNNGTFNMYRVTQTYNDVDGYSTEDGWQDERNIIRTEALLGNYTIPDNCSLIFVEDKLWLEGVVGKKVTVAAADVDTAGVAPSIILPDNITYTTTDGTTGLLAVAEDDVLIALDTPDNMTLYGIFVAQNGKFGRNHYTSGNTFPNWLDAYIQRDTLTMHGTIVSNGRVGTKWTSGSTFISGYETRYNSYDRDLVADPPPLTPETSDTYRFIEWREME